MDEDSEEGSRFSGYDRPRSTQGGNSGGTGGDGGGIPPTSGNIAGRGDPLDSNPTSDSDKSVSPSFDPRKILGRRKEHQDDARKAKYDKWLR